MSTGEVFGSGIRVRLACGLCGTRYTYKTVSGHTIRLTGAWREAAIANAARLGELYSDRRGKMLFCNDEHATDYAELEQKALAAAQAAFREAIRTGQANARSAVDALADVGRDGA